MTGSDWNTLLYLKPADFKYPDQLQFSVVSNLDKFIGIIGSRPVILSDFRAGAIAPSGGASQHGKGLAVDTTWPGHDPMDIWQKALNSQLFSGLGIYVNEIGAVSFHFDNRADRSPTNPALWGATITHPLDANTGQHVQKNEYTTVDAIIDIIKKKRSRCSIIPDSVSIIDISTSTPVMHRLPLDRQNNSEKAEPCQPNNQSQPNNQNQLPPKKFTSKMNPLSWIIPLLQIIWKVLRVIWPVSA